MSGFKNKALNALLQKDDFEQIASFIIEACRTVKSDYLNQGNRMPNDENRIRSILLKEYLAVDDIQRNSKMTEYRFEPETLENYDGKGNFIGRADIKVILKTDFEKNDAYYLIECKRIDGTKTLNKKYVNDGIARFVTKKYSSYYGKNFMLGFVVKDIDIQKNTANIESIQNTSALTNTYIHGKFSMESMSGNEELKYVCSYQLAEGKLELCHVFSNLSSVVK